MLTKSDKILIEKYLDYKRGHPDISPLTPHEQKTFNRRMLDPDFKNHLKLSDGINNAISNTRAIEFEKTLKQAATEYHNQN